METIKSWIAQGKLSALIEKTNQTGQPVLISPIYGNSVLLGEQRWKEISEKLKRHEYLKSIEKTPTRFRAKNPNQVEWQQTRDKGYFSDA